MCKRLLSYLKILNPKFETISKFQFLKFQTIAPSPRRQNYRTRAYCHQNPREYHFDVGGGRIGSYGRAAWDGGYFYGSVFSYIKSRSQKSRLAGAGPSHTFQRPHRAGALCG